MTFVKLNEEPIEIEFVEDEHDEARDFQPSFWWRNRRYYLEDFKRCHKNPRIAWLDFPEHIHAMKAENYFNPIFLEFIGDYAVNIYEEK